MKNKVLKYLLLSSCLVLLFGACRKDAFKGTETGSSGKTYIWISQGGGDPYVQYFDVFSDIKPVVLFTVRRDAANSGDLNKPVTVTLTTDADSTTNAGLTAFADGTYSVPTAADIASGGIYASSKGVTQTATGYTVVFAPGEFAKNIVVKVDGSKLDLSNTYGGVYKITGNGGLAVKSGYDIVAAGVAVKNAYDGTYGYAGTINRFLADGSADTASPLGGTIVAGATVTLATSGPNSDVFNEGIFWVDGISGVGGIGGLQLVVDPATNLVTVTATGNPYLKNIAGLDNYYDPATKTFHLNFGWNTAAPPSSSRQAHIVLTYQGPR